LEDNEKIPQQYLENNVEEVYIATASQLHEVFLEENMENVRSDIN